MALGLIAVLVSGGLAGFGLWAATLQMRIEGQVLATEQAMRIHGVADALFDDVRADVQRGLLTGLGLNDQSVADLRAELHEHLASLGECLATNSEAAIAPDIKANYAWIRGRQGAFGQAAEAVLDLASTHPANGAVAFGDFRKRFVDVDDRMDLVRDQLAAAGQAAGSEKTVVFARIRWLIVASFLAGAGLLAAITAIAVRLGHGIARALVETRQKADHLAHHDLLTGLPNRDTFVTEVGRRIGRHLDGSAFAVIVIEVASLAAVNQQFGAVIADAALKAIAGRLVDARKAGVSLARLSGAQLSGVGTVTGRDDALDRARKLHAALSQVLLLGGQQVPVDIRIGVAAFPNDGSEPDELLRKAQTALARAIANPLEPVALHDEAADARVQRGLALASDLRGAIDRGELELFYQPQVWASDRHVIGHEALLRWRHPRFGLVSPAEFIPIAEKTASILVIGRWTLLRACEEAATWCPDTRVAVNVSPLQLLQPDLPDQIEEALAHSGLAPHRLEIEITESLLITEQKHALDMMTRIKRLGVKLSLDDFGTGYSSMDVLRRFPFDKIKLDRSFVADLETSVPARAIVRAMLALGRELSIPVLVEGVETERQLAMLREDGCRKVQGYLTGRPSPASSIARDAVLAPVLAPTAAAY